MTAAGGSCDAPQIDPIPTLRDWLPPASMVYRPISNRVKKQKKRQLDNEKMRHALEAYAVEQTREPHLRQGLRKVADRFGVKWRTLGDLANGKRSMSAFNASKQKLTPGEEGTLVNLILESAD